MGRSHRAAAGDFSSLSSRPTAAVVVAGANCLAARNDLSELCRRGFPITMSSHPIWATPLMYLIVRGRQTRDDFRSCRLAWAHVFVTIGTIAFLVEAVLTVNFVNGTAHQR